MSLFNRSLTRGSGFSTVSSQRQTRSLLRKELLVQDQRLEILQRTEMRFNEKYDKEQRFLEIFKEFQK